MNVPRPDDVSALDHVLVLAPYRSDAAYLAKMLDEHEIGVDVASGIAELADRLSAAPGVLLLTHEALTRAVMEAVAAHLQGQQAWSEMPIVVLLDRGSPDARIKAELSAAWPRARQLFYKRPVTAVELVSGVQSALLARLRQRDVRDHISREIELRRELNHRVKNILASVASIFEVTRRGATTLDGFAADFRGRLGALDKVHSAVFRAEGEVVALSEIAELTFEPYRQAGLERIAVRGPAILLTREAGTTLALCLHELATNAIKYGALSRPEGRVAFEWSLVGDDRAELAMRWTESGGPPVEEPVRVGYGTRYLRSALKAMLGRSPTLVFDRAGLICEASGPLSRVAGNP
ncbi:sensor histidine kinase [Aureimonas pseudogalii]|uniref:histidine kinase n=1 Tax=Aureimonas pseudogalii TaxID=1744844 RepID=A0A7W6EA30_9HYPH|nr:sensor histidine kinase [Aureimonas pseudogalii]MBB3997059.1 two-component sensor histidine kinase [Aureimonas pseudogalii]